jgi:hypothetical protein
MPHPIIVISSFLTAIRSTWELSRMVREKRAVKTLKTEAKNTLVLLQRAYRKGLLLERQFDYLFERLMRAEACNDGRCPHRASRYHRSRLLVAAMRKIRADFQAILARPSGQQARRRVERPRDMVY